MNRSTRRSRPWFAAVALAATTALATAACGGSSTGSAGETAFQEGQVFTLVLGSSPGGGFDTQARMLQPYLDKALDEAAGVNVEIVVENMPGADHQIATEEVANSDEPTAIFSSLQLLTTNDVVKGASYDLTQLKPLASAGRSPRGLAAGGATAGATAQELLTGPDSLLLSHPGLDADFALMSAILADNGVKTTYEPIRLGQTAEIMTSMLRGEAQIGVSTLAGMAPFVADNPNDLRMVAALSCERDESMPEVPTIVEQGIPAADELCKTVGYDDRVFFGPPTMSDQLAGVLEKALHAALTNPEYQAAARGAGLTTGYLGAAELKDLTTTMVNTYGSYQLELPS
jgi:tripartite-type tricarboxylate transporter receptor subunit TctC